MPFRSIEDPVKLRRVLEATLLLAADLELRVLLRHLVEECCSITGARYGALGVLSEDRTSLAEFITVGIEPGDEERIGARPTGRGVLGLLITDPRPLRLADLSEHPDRYGFPPNHPPMSSFLGMPIKVRGEVYGNLYLTDKVGWSEFTTDDEALVGALAVAAGIGIENARLHQRVQEIAVYEDRDRLAQDLHDRVIQRLFSIGLSLQAMAGSAAAAGLADRLFDAITGIDETIREVRSAIFELGSSAADQGVRAQVVSLVRELTPTVGFEVAVTFAGPIDTSVSEVVGEHLLATVREALTNIGRHAEATEASVDLVVAAGRCRLSVVDNGRGLEASSGGGPGGLGLGNLRRRAEKLHGWMAVESRAAGGVSVVWDVPLDQ